MAGPRKIVHVDCDSFYASIEVRDNPALAGLPVAVGGSPERRGVVATCNYRAREFGIHSAMASSLARRLCPSLIIIRPDITRYRKASLQIHDIFRAYTHLIEPLSLDEAYLDLSDNERNDGSASLTAMQIRQQISAEVGITVSAGIAPNKFLAKIASDWNKPDGQFTIHPEEVDDFVEQLAVDKLFGVGKVTARRLDYLGIRTCRQLRTLTRGQLESEFGSFGERLYELSRGNDPRSVQPTRTRKSVSVENTFAKDLNELQACLDELPALHDKLLARLNVLTDNYRVSKQFVKIKFHDFVSTTVERVADNTAMQNYHELLSDGYRRGNRPVRLIGLGVKLKSLANTEATEDTSTQAAASPGQFVDSQLPLFGE